MRIITAFIFSLFAVNTLAAMDLDEFEDMFGPEAEITAFAGPDIKLSRVKGAWHMMAGGKAGLVVNNNFSFGFAGYLLLGSPDAGDSRALYGYSSDYLRMAYGGMFVEYSNSPHRLVNVSVSALLGGGGAAITGPVNYLGSHTFEEPWARDSGVFLVFEPGGSVEFNISGPLKIGAGFGYRYAFGLDLGGVSNRDIGGPSFSLSIKYKIN